MSSLSLQNRLCFLLLLLMAWASPRLGLAQTQNASTVVATDDGCVLVLCGTVENALHAVDGSAVTAASITPALALSSVAIRVGFASTVPVGGRVSMLVSFIGGGLNLGLLGQTSIRTYNSVGGPALQDFTANSLLSLTVLNGSTMLVEFPVTAAFKQLELRTGGVLNVLLGSYTVSLYQVWATATPLPVELTAFTGKASGATANLSWETASERNSDYFVVEREADAQEGFRAVGKVAAAGNSTQQQSYRFADAPPAGLSYYRLRQVDKDGTSTYSPVVAVKVAAVLTLQAYPNPAAGTVTVLGPAGAGFTLYNRLGQAVQQGTIPLAQASKLDLHELPDGVYFLRGPATGATVKVIKAAGILGQ